MKLKWGKFLEIGGVFVAIFGFMIAGKLGYSQLQIPLFIFGIIVSFIGFYILLGIPAPPVCKPPRKTYQTMREKHIEFLTRILGWFIAISIPVINIDFDELVAIIPFHIILPAAVIYIFFIIVMLLRDYKEIYRDRASE